MAHKKMNPEVKERWLKRLRSNISQGKGRLCNGKPTWEDGEFCCLGVVAKELGKLVNDRIGEVGVRYPEGREFGLEECELPEYLRKEIGITNDTMNLLMAMNDGTLFQTSKGVFIGEFLHNHQTLEQIADWIEENL